MNKQEKTRSPKKRAWLNIADITMALPFKQFDAQTAMSVATTELVGDFTVRDGDKGEITC